MKTIEEKNLAIAQFMGASVSSENGITKIVFPDQAEDAKFIDGELYCNPDQIRYDLHWGLLMHVVKKIASEYDTFCLNFDEGELKVKVEIYDDGQFTGDEYLTSGSDYLAVAYDAVCFYVNCRMEREQQKRDAEKVLSQNIETTYFLLGHDVCGHYHNISFESLLNELKSDRMSFNVVLFNAKETLITDFMEQVDGWGAYAEISEKEYILLKEVVDFRKKQSEQ